MIVSRYFSLSQQKTVPRKLVERCYFVLVNPTTKKVSAFETASFFIFKRKKEIRVGTVQLTFELGMSPA